MCSTRKCPIWRINYEFLIEESIVKSRTFLPAHVLLGNNITDELSLLKGSDGSSEVYYSCLQNPTAAALLDPIDHAPSSLPTNFACDQRIASPSIQLLCSHNYNRKSFLNIEIQYIHDWIFINISLIIYDFIFYKKRSKKLQNICCQKHRTK